MKEKIQNINQLIENKRSSLKENASRSFENITFPTAIVNSRRKYKSGNGKTPGLTYILYATAIVLAIIAIFTDEGNILFWILAILSAIIGFAFSKRSASLKINETSPHSVNLPAIKTDTISKGIDVVKKTTREWDEFMEKEQKEVFAAIDSSDLSDSEKDKLSSKIFSYEVIDVNLSDLMSMINSSRSISDIQKNLASFKMKMLSAIDTAANSQINRYRSLLNED